MTKPGWILRGIVLFGTVLVGSGAAAEPYSRTVQRISRLQPGVYVGEADANETCVDGELVLKDQADGRVTIFLGGHVIVPGLGDPEEGGERDLSWSTRSEVTDRRIAWRKTGTLAGKPVRWMTSLTVHPGGFTYVTTYRGKPVTCVLTLK